MEKKSHTQEKSIIKVWKNLPIAHRPIASIKQSDLIHIRDNWEKQLKPATIVRRFALLSHLYTTAIKDWQWYYLADNPVQKIRKPSVKNARNRRILNDIRIIGTGTLESPNSEVEWIVRETKSEYLPMIITLAIETAMRRSEIANIRRQHIDFESNTLYIPHTKNGHSRTVPLSPIAKYSLIMYFAKNNQPGLIFKISPEAITKAFIRALRKARARYESMCERKGQVIDERYFNNLRFHDLRHEATSRLASVYEIHELAKVTGHLDTRMLLRYYHPDAEYLGQKLIKSQHGQEQFSVINHMLLQML
ncbi:site-specific tyrosine recombinase XerC [Oligella ureolytica]|uniref:Site-specific tyrosine recombinase XerC n=1 Tax=Oligella ureolytica TaxID=90244 RepID=A0A378XDH2_9BURK|nr:tyrosine-type recombinase/integrase [Oligella ureolytica]SUA52703.1 site-specific tyrosine recombinase XerC [Oligella ureolytica]SUA58119.1 site-specific tyrosine recombinase XerC [Oligella ureolytica]